MKDIECPEIYTGDGKEKSLFIAGGISGCKVWQDELVDMLKNEDITLLNPRRKFFKVDDLEVEKEQIKWEYEHLRKADGISFWFPNETVCPITLYELGAWAITDKPLFVGVDSGYLRKRDVEIQLKLVRPDIEIVYDLPSLFNQIKEWIKNNKV